MLGFLLLAFLVVPIVELYLFIQVADSIGFLAALVWIVLVSFLGAWLMRREGMGVLRRANAQVAEGTVPTDELINGVAILFGGALMLTPGFLTDITGLLLFLPPVRALLRRALRGRFSAGPIVLGGRFGGPTSGAGASFGFGGPTTGGFGFGGPRSGGPRRNPFGVPDDDVVDAESWEEPPDRPELP